VSELGDLLDIETLLDLAASLRPVD